MMFDMLTNLEGGECPEQRWEEVRIWILPRHHERDVFYFHNYLQLDNPPAWFSLRPSVSTT